MRRTRRSFGTIHFGHLPEKYSEMADKLGSAEDALTDYFGWLKRRDWEALNYPAGAMALERGEKGGTLHVQFYIEHTPKWPKTRARQFGNVTQQVFFDTVRSAQGSWDYCTGQGRHVDKSAVSRFQWGKPILFGSTENESSLRWVVHEIVSGAHPRDILESNAYAYTVHRQRLWALYQDLQRLEKGREILPAPM